MPRDQIVLDLETKNSFDDVGSRNPAALGVSLVGVYFYERQEYRAFREEEFSLLEQSLSEATRIIGFNTHRFDFPALQPYMKRLKLADLVSFDILENLEKLLGHRVSLQNIATTTLNVGKSGSGLDAITYFRHGEWDKLTKYCLDDVRITKDVYEFGKKFGSVYYTSKDGRTKLQANVQWADPAPSANLTLF